MHEITCARCGMTGAQVRRVRAEGLDLGAERIAVDPDAPCCTRLYIRNLAGESSLVATTPESSSGPAQASAPAERRNL